MRNDVIYVNFCRNWKKKLSAKNKKSFSVVYFWTCLFFSTLFRLSTDIIFTEFGTINNLKLPLFYLDKLASYDVIIPNTDSSISSKLPAVMINVLTKSHPYNCRGRMLFASQKEFGLLWLQAFLSRCISTPWLSAGAKSAILYFWG